MRFSRRAADYERHATPQARIVAHFAGRIPASGGESALELGAGTGLLTRELLAKGYRVTATDLSPEMVATGRAGVPGAAWRTLDAFTAPTGPVPLIFSANLLQWAASPTDVLRHLREALAPEGRMYHAVLVSPTLDGLHRLAGDAVPVRFLPADAWLTAAAGAGLEIRHREIFGLRQSYADTRALLRDLHGTGAVATRPALGAGGLRNLIRRHDRENALPEGGIATTWTALIFEAVRRPRK